MIVKARVQAPSGRVDPRCMGYSRLPTGEHEGTTRSSRPLRVGKLSFMRKRTRKHHADVRMGKKHSVNMGRESVTRVTGRKVGRTEEKKQKEEADV